MLQTSFVVVLTYFILTLVGSSFATSSGLEGSLSGLKLRCCVLHEPPISFLDNRTYSNGGINGIIAQYLRQLQGYLNWSCSSVENYSAGESTGFNEFIAMMERCSENGTAKNDPSCTCDIGIGGWFPNHLRHGRVDFLPPFVIDGYDVVFHISNSEVSGQRMFFITTFDRLAWLSIFGLLILFSSIKMFDRRFCPVEPYQPLSPKTPRARRSVYFLLKYPTLYRFRKAVQSTFSRMALLPDSEVVQNQKANRQWMLNTIISISGLFLILSYEASMTASIVQESISPGFQSIQEFQQCVINPKDVCLPGGGAMETYWNNSIAIDECHAKQRPYFGSTYEALLAALDNGTCKYGIFLESTATAAIHSKYCGKLLAAEEAIYSGGLSMVLPRKSNLTDLMSYATLKIINELATPHFEQYFASLPRCSVKHETTLNFRKLRLFFGIAFCTGGFFLLLVVINNAWNQAIERASGKNDESQGGGDKISSLPESSFDGSDNSAP